MDVSSDPESQHRMLIYFPIVHTQADMGALGESVKKATLRKIGRLGWKRKVELIDQFWTAIERSIDNLSLSFDRVRVYQDGLPISGKESDIVKQLAKSGSRNHAVLLRLMDKGAHLMGTESLELLLEEYEQAKKDLAGSSSHGKSDDDGSGSVSLLDRRDRFVAERINETLRQGEVGIIFLGMLHDPQPWLDQDIEVVYPIQRPVKR